LKRLEGIEPSPSAWKADVLPLNYNRIKRSEKSIMERRAGIEPAFAQGGSPMCDMDSGGYRSTYTPHQVGQAGIEPATQGFSVPCSTN
jgi:hypothetical protein